MIYLICLLFLMIRSDGQRIGRTENVLYDFAKVAEPNATKIAYFYNIDETNKTIPIDQTNLNRVSSYLTINTVLNCTDWVVVRYYMAPNFQQLNGSKYINEPWIGTRPMDQKDLTTWIQYSQNILKSPTFAWIMVTRFCFKDTNDVDLYDYTAMIPVISQTMFMYVFTWKDKNMDSCVQTTFSLKYDKIVCIAMKGIDCTPPYRV
jgi:hypothetical protein